MLRARDPTGFPHHLRNALRTRRSAVPPQTGALARLWWPLVLTTNYDDYFLDAFESEHGAGAIDVVGRGATDCQRVLNALAAPAGALLWALQGYVGGLRRKGEQNPFHQLEPELVVGHEEYRRVTHKEQHFRRAFAEVYRNRSFLFVGSGLKETYLLELFGEVMELWGPSVHPNYAIVPEGEVDRDFLLARFETVVVEYDADQPAHHGAVPQMLEELADSVDRRTRCRSWGFAVGPPVGPVAARRKSECGRLHVERGPLPEHPGAGECFAVSAGGEDDGFFFSEPIAQVLRRQGIAIGKSRAAFRDGGGRAALRSVAIATGRPADAGDDTHPLLAVFEGADVYAVRARSEGDLYDLSVIDNALRQLLEAAAAAGYTRVRATLLATGGKEVTRAKAAGERQGEWRRRPFPARYSFTEMVRAYASWCRYHESGLELAIHVVDPVVERELAGGRLDVHALLDSDERIRFWAEVDFGLARVERRLMDESPHKLIGQAAAALDLPTDGDDWQFEVLPAARVGGEARPLAESANLTLEEAGVVMESTLRFARRKPDTQRPGGTTKPPKRGPTKRR